jgi:hypothetical protein
MELHGQALPKPERVRRVLVCLLLGGVVSLVGAATTTPDVPPNPGYLYAYRDAQTRLDAMIAKSDGQAYAQIARDPRISDPDAFDSSLGNWAAYRASRPLWGWVAAIVSFGQRGWTFAAMFALEWLSIAFLLFVVTARVGWWGCATVALPGVIQAAKALTPEPFGMALVLTGWLPLVGLVRETYLLFPFANFIKTRDLRYLIPFALYGGWVLFVFLGGVRGGPPGLVELPLRGFIRAAPYLTMQAWVGLGLFVVLAAAALSRYPLQAGLFCALILVSRTETWFQWLDFGRIALPLEVLGVMALVQILQARLSGGRTRPEPV